MKSSHLFALLLAFVQAAQGLDGTQFTSHVSVNTPASSYSHGVGDPLPADRAYRQPQSTTFRRLRRPVTPQGRSLNGYPRQKPAIPFQVEDLPSNIRGGSWQLHKLKGSTISAIPVLPPSPYKVDSPDPESLWPVGLFLPPVTPLRFGSHRRTDTAETDPEDPYLLEGSEAVAAVVKAKHHGQLYFHDIPHIESLLANQELRVANNLEPHRIASIRQTWPFNRP